MIVHVQTPNAVVTDTPCGCIVTGLGTHAHPFRIDYCGTHSLLTELPEISQDATIARSMHLDARAKMYERAADALADLMPLLKCETLCGPEGFATIVEDGRFPALIVSMNGAFYHHDQRGIMVPISRLETVTMYGFIKILDALRSKFEMALTHLKSAEKVDRQRASVEALAAILALSRKAW